MKREKKRQLKFAKNIRDNYADHENGEKQYFRRGDQYFSYQEDRDCWLYNAENDEVVYQIFLESATTVNVEEVNILVNPDTINLYKESFENNTCIDLDLVDAVKTIITDERGSEGHQALEAAYEKFFSACNQDPAMTTEDWEKVLPKYENTYTRLKNKTLSLATGYFII